MKNNKHVPGSKTLMPIVIETLQKNGGTLSYSQVVYLIMFKYDLPQKLLKKAHNEVGFSGVYLRKLGVLSPDSKRGTWTLAEDYMTMSFEQLKKTTYEKYDALFDRN